MQNATQLQCKALRGLKKSRRRRNNAKQWKNNAQNNRNSRKIRASADVPFSSHRHPRALKYLAFRRIALFCVLRFCGFARRLQLASQPVPSFVSHYRGAVQCSPEKLPEKYRRFTGRRCAPNAAKAIEIAEEKARNLNRRKTGPENRKNRAMNRWIAPVSGGRIPGLLFLPQRDNRPPRAPTKSFAATLRA
jgi:hypothetical protein